MRCLHARSHKPEDNEAPFPWKRSQRSHESPATSSDTQHFHSGGMVTTEAPLDSNQKMRKKTHSMTEKQLDASPRLNALSTQCQTHGPIRFELCHLTASAGAVLRHCIQLLECLFKKEEPLTFKIGFTHNPVWRWSNSIYGYCNSKDKWAEMIIMYYSREPYSAAMLEAALIEKYNGN